MEESCKFDEDSRDMSQINIIHRAQFSFNPVHKVSKSDCGLCEDGINRSPCCLLLSNDSSLLGRRFLSDNSSPTVMENSWRHSSTNHSALCETPVLKPATELVKEIAALECEVLHLERYLLSLYRAAFERQVAMSAVNGQPCDSPSTCKTCSPPVKSTKYQSNFRCKTMSIYEASVPINSRNVRRIKSCGSEEMEEIHDFCETPRSDLGDQKYGSLLSAKNTSIDSPRPISYHGSLVGHLGSSVINFISETPQLSEEIIRCIASIYGKLAYPPMPRADFLPSPISSLSSSSTFSPQNTSDAWSLKYPNETTSSPCISNDSKGKEGPYRGMLEVLKICIDGDRYNFAASTLQHLKNLIRRLETVDPRKMEHDEKLAFWINIYNALVMHAFLAYGLHQNYMKCTASIMKAAYNVGGLSVNAYEIQRSILECQLRRPEKKIQALFSQPQKFIKVNGKHAYALDSREPLVHFALCAGGYSDPAVRIYTPKNVLKELEIARDEFVRSSVSIHREGKISLPKILQYYARDASMELSATLDMVKGCMPEIQQKSIQRIFCTGRPEKCVEWLPYKSNFRYLIHRDLASN